MITFKIPGLPDESGRLSWEGLQVEYSRGKTLAQYLQLDLQLRPDQVSHVVVDGAIYRPEKTLEVRLRESRSEKFWRKFRGAPPPVETISEFDAFRPQRGAEIAVVPIVAGKNTAIILGVVGAVIGFYLAGPGGGVAGWKWGAALGAAFQGYAIGSMIGSLLTPAPKLRKEGDDGSSTYTFNGPRNDVRAGMAQPVLMGEHLVGGMFIGGYRRRENQKERIYMLISPSVGPVEGPRGVTDPNAAPHIGTNKPDFRINGQHYSNYEGVTVDWRNGDDVQTVIPGFNSIINTYPIGLSEVTAGGYRYTTVSDKVDAFEVLLELPALVHLKSTGEVRSNATRYNVRYRPEPFVAEDGWIAIAGPQELTAATRSKYLAQFRKEGLPQARYQIELTWVSADHTDVAKDAWKIYVSGITEETQTTKTYPGSALMAISGLATEQLNNAWPMVTGVWRGIKVEPWNGASFDPLAWGRGTPAPVGQNTGWLALQLLRNKIFGAGDEMPNADIDLASFKTLADWCAENETVNVEGGGSYTEPRFQFDLYMDQQQPLLDFLNDMLGSCRASIVLSGNKWRAVMDRSATPVQLFNMGNIIQGSMQIQYRSEKARLNTFEGQFVDRSQDYETDTVTTCIDKTGAFKTVEEMAAQGITLRRRQSSMPGVTRRTQAVRENRFRLKSIFALRRIVGFGAFTDSILAEAGDVVNIAHDLPQWGYSGRVQDGSTASIIMFDREVPLVGGTTYQVACRFADGTAEAGEIRTVADTAPPDDGSDYFGVVVTVPFSRVPAEGDLWVYGPINTLTKPVRIVEISRDSDQQRMIIASDYNESIHNTDGAIVIPTYSQLPIYNAPPPAIPTVTAFEETAARLDDRRPSVVVIQWTQPRAEAGKGLYKDAHLEWSLNQVNWESFGFHEREFRWVDAYQGETVYFRVTPRSTAGILNPTGAASTSLLISGHTLAPGQVASFTARAFEGQFIFEWPEVALSLQYEIRDSNPADWKADQVTGFVWRGRGQKFVIEQPAARSKQLYLRTVDDFKNYAVAAVNATATDSAPAAPTIDSIDRFKNALKVSVSPPAPLDPNDYIAIHLHASQTPGFVPDDSNRVAQMVDAKGGEFVYQVPSGGTPNWYFKATVEDWLSLRLGGWVYSTESSAALVVITPALPTAVTQSKIATQRRVLQKRTLDNDYEPIEMPKCLVSWNHTDTVGNPSGALIGFEVILYTTDPQAPLEQTGIITKTSAASYTHLFDYLVFDTNTTVIAAVRAVYTDNINSAYVNSAGQVLGPSPETPLSELVQDELGRFELPESAADYFPLDKSAFGVRGTRPLIAPVSVYGLDGYGAVVERSLVEQIVDVNDLTIWNTWAAPQVGPTVSVTKVTDGSVRPPVRDGWDVFKLTKITSSGEGYIFRGFVTSGSVANRWFSGSVWVLNGRTEDLQFYPYLFTNSASAGHQVTMIRAGAWKKIQTGPVQWSGADSSTSIAIVIRSMSMNVGEFFYVAVPQLQTDIYFAHEPPPPAGSVLQVADTGQLVYPPLSIASKNWTLFFKMRAKEQSVPKYMGNTYGYAAYMRTAGDLNVMGVYLSGLGVGGTRKLGFIATDGTSTFNPTEYTIPLAAYDDHVVAIKRNDTEIKVWLNGVLAISGTMAFDPTSGARIISKFFVGTHPGEGDLAAMNAAFRNLTVFSVALTDADIVAISKQGARFVAPAPRIVVPRPLTVTLTEEDNV